MIRGEQEEGEINDNIGFLKLTEAIFCFLDVETTGLKPQFGDRICEIALLRWRNGQTLETFHSLVNPERPISPGAFAVNGITEAMVRDAPKFKELALQVLTFLKDTVIVAHNAPFDMSFLNFQLANLGLPLPRNPVLCTLSLARRCFCFPSNGLGAIARYLGVKVEQEHRAMSDVKTTREIFRLFLQDFRRKGLEYLGELIELQGGTIPIPTPEAVILPPPLEEAIHSQKPVQIRYLSYWGEETYRVIEPIEVINYGDCVYLTAFCHLRQEQRTFRLDRILEIHPIEKEGRENGFRAY